MKKMTIMLLGCGTVGRGVYQALVQNGPLIEERLNLRVTIGSVLIHDPHKERHLPGIEPLLTTQFAHHALAETDVVIEVMGGVEPARTYIQQALENGCHVVTANKELMAKHGVELANLAHEHGVQLLYEASVGGGIPLIGVLQNFLKTNRIIAFSGILNGTTNYILTQMEQTGRPWSDVLQEAQQKGYAEADPTSDIEGYDAMYKLVIVTRLAFGIDVFPPSIYREGITDLTAFELQLAQKCGYTTKLLANARLTSEGDLSLEVRLTRVPQSHPLASISDVYNALYIIGDGVQDITLSGQGAGEKPTAHAIVEDVTNVHRIAPDVFPPTLSLTEVAQERAIHYPVQSISFQLNGLHNEHELRELHGSLARLGLQVQQFAWLHEEGKSWVGFICSNWDEQKWQHCLSSLALTVNHFRRRPCLESVSQTKAEAPMLPVGSI